MEGGPDRRRSSILTDRNQDRGFYRAIAASVGVHVLFLLVLFVGGDLDLRPDRPETYSAGLAGGLPPGLEARLPDLGGDVPRVDPAPPPPPKPRPADRKPPPDGVAAAEPVKKKSDEPADLILPAPATATPAATASPTPRPTPSPDPTASPAPTATPSPSATTTATPMATATPTPVPTATRSPKPEPTASPAPTAKPKPSAKPQPKPTATKKPPAKKVAPPPTAKPAPEKKRPEKKEDKPAAPVDEKIGATEPAKERTRTTPRSAALDPTVKAGGETAAERDARIAAAMARVRARVGSGTPTGGAGGTGGTSGTGGGGAGAGGAGSGSGGFGTGTGAGGALRGADFLLYYNEMITRIRDAWVWVGGSADLEVEVGFRVTRLGDIVDVRTVRASGDRSYDESVLRALRTVRNLGPPPERHRETFSQVQLTFRPADLESGP